MIYVEVFPYVIYKAPFAVKEPAEVLLCVKLMK